MFQLPISQRFLLTLLLITLAGCANTPNAQDLERTFAADPSLVNGVGSPSPTPTIDLPPNFPPEIPIYPQAQLQSPESPNSNQAGNRNNTNTPNNQSNQIVMTRWVSGDPSNLIQSFYERELRSKGWQIQPLTNSTNNSTNNSSNNSSNNSGLADNDLDNTLIATKDGLNLRLKLQPQTASGTTFSLEYRRGQENPFVNPSPNIVGNPATNQTNSNNSNNPNNPNNPNNLTSNPSLPNPPGGTQANNPNNLNNPNNSNNGAQAIPEQLRQAVVEVVTLGVLTSDAQGTKIDLQQLEPNKPITKREYARWLVAANNRIYSNESGQQVRLATSPDQPAFNDIAATDADFGTIQGLAAAGVIPSRLSGDQTATFSPEAIVTREQLILWKVPLDTRQALPTTSIEAVQQTWGFQDAARIDPLALRAVVADFQNGNLANIRRVFGFTTLFQPQRPVTRAEAVAALWYFGSQGRGISAKDAQQNLDRSTGNRD